MGWTWCKAETGKVWFALHGGLQCAVCTWGSQTIFVKNCIYQMFLRTSGCGGYCLVSLWGVFGIQQCWEYMIWGRSSSSGIMQSRLCCCAVLYLQFQSYILLQVTFISFRFCAVQILLYVQFVAHNLKYSHRPAVSIFHVRSLLNTQFD